MTLSPRSAPRLQFLLASPTAFDLEVVEILKPVLDIARRIESAVVNGEDTLGSHAVDKDWLLDNITLPEARACLRHCETVSHV